MADEDLAPGREQMQWPLDDAAVRAALNTLNDGTKAAISPLEAALLEALTSAGGSLAFGEIVEKLAADYDRPPTREAVMKVHLSRMNPHTRGAPSNK